MQRDQELIARLRTANTRFTDAQTERIWAIVSAHQDGLSIRRIAGATGLSSSRNHQLLNAPEAKEIPVWLSQPRQSSGGYAPKKKAERPEPETKIGSRLSREVEALRRCIDWLQARLGEVLPSLDKPLLPLRNRSEMSTTGKMENTAKITG